MLLLQRINVIMQYHTQGATVIVPTLNRGPYLLAALRDLLKQEYRPLEVMVIDQSKNCEDGNAALQAFVAAHPERISYHNVNFRGLPLARNYGWQKAKYSAIVFVDDDIRCSPDFVTQHLRVLSLPDVGLVAGGVYEPNKNYDPGPPTGTFNRWTATPVRGFANCRQHEVDHAVGCNFSAWRRALESCGGVDEQLAFGAGLYEETDLCLRIKRAGYRIYFNGKAQLEHLAVATGGCRVKDPTAYVVGLAHNRALVIRRHLRWFQVPIALGRLAALTFSHALYYRTFRALIEFIPACLQGLRDGAKSPICTKFAHEDR
jgi:GT2 family glycosyltransferase